MNTQSEPEYEVEIELFHEDGEKCPRCEEYAEVCYGKCSWNPLRIVDVEVGALPQVAVHDHTTAERCYTCGRVPGVVSAPGVDRFDLGVKHCLNRLSRLIQKETGATQPEAEAIVLRLQAADVELP